MTATRPPSSNLTAREAKVCVLDKFLKGMRTNHGNATAKMFKTLLSGMMSLATRHGATPGKPVPGSRASPDPLH